MPYLYKVRKKSGIWKIVDADCIYERDEIIPVIPSVIINIDLKELTSYRESYQGLCYVLSRTGLKVDKIYLVMISLKPWKKFIEMLATGFMNNMISF
ncbi:hypothetical protein [Lentilactobacillus kosonis]|uniref:hypothetical protein n=1 Tax=Lentilactobacillus kosonis TaxID=2810561 RepID=UPI000F622282|nr:hypothetical protein [Lentilactobacillus kosonis]